MNRVQNEPAEQASLTGVALLRIDNIVDYCGIMLDNVCKLSNTARHAPQKRGKENTMAVETWLDIISTDKQGYQDTLTFRVKDLAFAAAQTLPTAAKIEAVIDAIYGPDKPSTNIVTSYQIRVQETVSSAVGGSGSSPTSEAARVRNSLTAIPGNWLFRIPGLDKSAVSFDPSNPNSISTSGAPWAAIRTALADAAIAVSDPAGAYVAVPSTEIAEAVSAVDGRRAPLRPR